MSRIDRLQRRHPGLGLPIAVVYKYVDDTGGYLAALITYYAFVSLFPLLLIFTTVLGFILTGHSELQQRIETSALGQFPVIGNDLGQPHRISGGTVGLVVGGLGALYGGLGVAQATQYAMNAIWAVPRHVRPNPLRGRALSLLILATIGVAILATTALSALASNAESCGVVVRILGVAAAIAVNAATCVFLFRFAPARRLSFHDVFPGALAAAASWQLLQTFGVVYVDHVVKHASATNGVFAVVLGLLAFLYLTAVATILSVEINAVRVGRLYPRALLTPFTDKADLTTGDERAYTGQAQAQQAKGFEDIDVTFDRPTDQDA